MWTRRIDDEVGRRGSVHATGLRILRGGSVLVRDGPAVVPGATVEGSVPRW